jgi:hypothetical protein
LAILSPERFGIEGFIGANFDNQRGGPDGIEKSVNEIELILEKAGMAGKWPVKHGSHPMQYKYVPSESEGVDFIIERAMAGSPDNERRWIDIEHAREVIGYMPQDRAEDYLQAQKSEKQERCTNG